MTNKENLVLEVGPQQLVSYGTLLVAFYDDYKLKIVDEDGILQIMEGAEPSLHIHIQNSEDKYSITKRAAGVIRNKSGMRAHEKDRFAKAYAKYLTIKGNGGIVDSEKAAMAKRIAELEANAAKIVKVAPALKKAPVKITEAKTETKK